jgi:hypothetical protein
MAHYHESVLNLISAGIEKADAIDLRRISMTLHRWHEMECGDSNDYCSYSLVRGRKVDGEFTYDDAGKPFLEMHRHSERKVRYEPIADREKGALKRLAAIMARYPGFEAYVQTDPRGAALYILHPNAIAGADAFSKDQAKRAEWLSANYSRGIAVYK